MWFRKILISNFHLLAHQIVIIWLYKPQAIKSMLVFCAIEAKYCVHRRPANDVSTCTVVHKSGKEVDYFRLLHLPLRTSGLTYAKLPRWSLRRSSSRTRCLLSAKLMRMTSCVLCVCEREKERKRVSYRHVAKRQCDIAMTSSWDIQPSSKHTESYDASLDNVGGDILIA